MSSFVGDLWKKVGELKMSVAGGNSISAFPFIYNEAEIVGRVGPFAQFTGQDYESSSRKEDSVFRRVSVFCCKERNGIAEAKRILKNLKTMRHPRMLRFISAKESDSEVVVVTEWVESFRMRSDDLGWQKWAKWSVKEVEEFLKTAGRTSSIDCITGTGNLWITASGEVKVALFNENASGNDELVSVDYKVKNDLIHLTETFDRLVTLSSGERAGLIKKLLSNSSNNQQQRPLPNDFLKFLILPELLKSRKFIQQQGNEISLEEVQFLFVKGRELIGEDGSEDFMFLLSDFYCELLGNAGNSVGLTGCLLDQVHLGLCKLFTEKYAQDRIYPLVAGLTGHPLPAIRESALKALEGLCGKMSEKMIGNEVLRVLARMQGDNEGGLRVKAIGVLSETVWGKISEGLKAKICGPAVSRALSDPYAPCKRAGLNLLRKGISLLPPQEIVSKLIPGVAGLLIERDGGLRAEGFECMEKVVLPVLKRADIKESASSPVSSVSSASAVNKTTQGISSSSGVSNVSTLSNTVPTSNNTSNTPKPISSKPCSSSDDVKTEMFSNDPIPGSNQTTTALPSSSKSKMKLGSIKKIV